MGFEQPESIPTESKALHLKGHGIRTKWLMNIYTAGLYLEKDITEINKDAQWLVHADSPMAIRLVVMRDNLDSQRIMASTRQGFESSNGGPQPQLQDKLEQMLTMYQEKVNKGDVFVLHYQPNTGLVISKNGEISNTITGLSFKQAVFNIWLGDKPIQRRLKQQLLDQ